MYLVVSFSPPAFDPKPVGHSSFVTLGCLLFLIVQTAFVLKRERLTASQ